MTIRNWTAGLPERRQKLPIHNRYSEGYDVLVCSSPTQSAITDDSLGT